MSDAALEYYDAPLNLTLSTNPASNLNDFCPPSSFNDAHFKCLEDVLGVLNPPPPHRHRTSVRDSGDVSFHGVAKLFLGLFEEPPPPLYDRLFYLSKLEKSRLPAGFSFRCRGERRL